MAEDRRRPQRGASRTVGLWHCALQRRSVKQDRVLGYALVSRAAAQGLAPRRRRWRSSIHSCRSRSGKKGACPWPIAKAKSSPPPELRSLLRRQHPCQATQSQTYQSDVTSRPRSASSAGNRRLAYPAGRLRAARVSRSSVQEAINIAWRSSGLLRPRGSGHAPAGRPLSQSRRRSRCLLFAIGARTSLLPGPSPIGLLGTNRAG